MIDVSGRYSCVHAGADYPLSRGKDSDAHGYSMVTFSIKANTLAHSLAHLPSVADKNHIQRTIHWQDNCKYTSGSNCILGEYRYGQNIPPVVGLYGIP